MPTATSTPPLGKPLLKWVGGKARLLPHILSYYDNQPHLVEPFFGGGAVSFALAAKNPELRVTGNDKIAELVDIYRAIGTDVDAFIAGVETYALPYLALTTKDERRAQYYTIRDAYVARDLDGPEVLYFLLRTAYAGLYRTSKRHVGRFNTPHGYGDEQPGFYQPDRLRAAAPLLRHWSMGTGDFADTLDAVTPQSFVYLDPPYRETYGGYTDDGFTQADQERVVEYALAAHDKGATFVYSNKYQDDGFYEDSFRGFTIEKLQVRHQVNHNVAAVGRPPVTEVLVTNHHCVSSFENTGEP